MKTWLTRIPPDYQNPTLYAVLLHLFFVGFLSFNFFWSHKTLSVQQTKNTGETIIQAKAVTQKQLTQAVEKKASVKRAAIQKQRNIKAAREKAKREVVLKKKRALEKRKKIALAKKHKAQAEKKRRADALKQKRVLAKKALEKKQKALVAKQLRAKKALEKKHQQQLAEKRLQQQLAKESEQLNAAHQKQVMTIIDRYKAMITAAIGQHWLLPSDTDKQLACQFLIKLSPSGTVLSAQLVKSSGNPALDRSAQAAILKASPLPVPREPQLAKLFRDIKLTVRPEAVLSSA